MLREINEKAPIITTPIAQLDGRKDRRDHGTQHELWKRNFWQRSPARNVADITQRVSVADMIMNIITTTMIRKSMSTTTTMITRSTSTTTTMTMKDMSITTIMTMKDMTIIMTTITSVDAVADTIIIMIITDIIMLMRSSQAGAVRPCRNIQQEQVAEILKDPGI